MTERLARRLAEIAQQPKRQRTESSARVPVERPPQRSEFCGINGCTRLKPKNERACFRCQWKDDAFIEVERSLRLGSK